MSSFFFSGSHSAKLDEKGRLVLPQEMRFGLVEEGKCEFAIGLGLGGCLTVYRKSAIAKIVETFRKHQHIAKFQKFFTLFFSTLYQTECDKVGRVMIPASLKEMVGIDKEVVIAGVMDKIEIWSKKAYDAQLSSLFDDASTFKDVTEEAFALLNEDYVEEAPSVEQILNPVYMAPLSPKS